MVFSKMLQRTAAVVTVLLFHGGPSVVLCDEESHDTIQEHDLHLHAQAAAPQPRSKRFLDKHNGGGKSKDSTDDKKGKDDKHDKHDKGDNGGRDDKHDNPDGGMGGMGMGGDRGMGGGRDDKPDKGGRDDKPDKGGRDDKPDKGGRDDSDDKPNKPAGKPNAKLSNKTRITF